MFYLGYNETMATPNLRVGRNLKDMQSSTSPNTRMYLFISKKKKKNLPTTISVGFIVKYLFPDEADHFNSKQK